MKHRCTTPSVQPSSTTAKVLQSRGSSHCLQVEVVFKWRLPCNNSQGLRNISKTSWLPKDYSLKSILVLSLFHPSAPCNDDLRPPRAVSFLRHGVSVAVSRGRSLGVKSSRRRPGFRGSRVQWSPRSNNLSGFQKWK